MEVDCDPVPVVLLRKVVWPAALGPTSPTGLIDLTDLQEMKGQVKNNHHTQIYPTLVERHFRQR